MFIIGNLLLAAGKILDLLIGISYLLVIGRAVISWLDIEPGNQIARFLYVVTEPVLGRVRRYVPSMGIDISPVIVLFVLYFADIFVVGSLMDMGLRLR